MKDRPSDTTLILYLGITGLLWLGLISLFYYTAGLCVHGAFLAGYATAGGRGLLVLAALCGILELYVIIVGLIVLISALLVHISRPAQRHYSKFVDKTIGKFFPFRTAAWLIRPRDITQHATRSENGQ